MALEGQENGLHGASESDVIRGTGAFHRSGAFRFAGRCWTCGRVRRGVQPVPCLACLFPPLLFPSRLSAPSTTTTSATHSIIETSEPGKLPSDVADRSMVCVCVCVCVWVCVGVCVYVCMRTHPPFGLTCCVATRAISTPPALPGRPSSTPTLALSASSSLPYHHLSHLLSHRLLNPASLPPVVADWSGSPSRKQVLMRVYR